LACAAARRRVELKLRREVGGAPPSPFVRAMQAAVARRLDAPTVGAKRAVEREMEGIMREHLGGQSQSVESTEVDRKVAAAGCERE
jgi:hypothetical protein